MLRLTAVLDARLQRDAGISSFEYQALWRGVRLVAFDGQDAIRAAGREVADVAILAVQCWQ